MKHSKSMFHSCISQDGERFECILNHQRAVFTVLSGGTQLFYVLARGKADLNSFSQSALQPYDEASLEATG